MLIAIFVGTTLVVATATAIILLGNGNVHRGRLRAVRRIRSARRRWVRPRMSRLGYAVERAWTRPIRSSVAREIRRVANRLDRAAAGADRYADAQRGLSKAVERLAAIGPSAWGAPGEPGRRKAREIVTGQGWLVALALALVGLAVAGGNGWLLYRRVLPAVPQLGVLPGGVVDSLYLAAFAAAFPFVLGLAYFALNAAGRALGYRVLAVVVALMVVLLGGLEAAAAVVALEELGIARPTWWGGVAVATLLGGTAALLPPTIAALAHSAIERFDRWLAARDRRAAGRAVARQDRMAGGLRRTVDELTTAVDGVRSELLALGSDPAGQLILHPAGQPSVERTRAVLRRVAASVEREAEGPWVERPTAAAVASRVLWDLAALAVWGLASAAALLIVAAGLQRGVEVGMPGIMTAGAFAAIAALLVSGLVLRRIFNAPGRRPGTAARASAVALVGLAAASLALAVGTLAGQLNDVLFPTTWAAAAWLNLLVLVAALASLRLTEGIAAAAAIVAVALAVAAWVALGLLDTVLAGYDFVLSGFRRRHRRHAPEPARPSPAVNALGGAVDRH